VSAVPEWAILMFWAAPSSVLSTMYHPLPSVLPKFNLNRHGKYCLVSLTVPICYLLEIRHISPSPLQIKSKMNCFKSGRWSWECPSYVFVIGLRYHRLFTCWPPLLGHQTAWFSLHDLRYFAILTMHVKCNRSRVASDVESEPIAGKRKWWQSGSAAHH